MNTEKKILTKDLELKVTFAKRSEFFKTGYYDWHDKKKKSLMLVFDTLYGKNLFEKVCYKFGGVKIK